MPTVTLANGRRFSAERGVSILDAALASGFVLEHSCRTGRCGTCATRVTSGDTLPLRQEVSLTEEDSKASRVLTCVREAVTDVAIDSEDLSALAGIAPKTLPCRIDTLTRIAPDVIRVELRLPPNAGWAFRAGQYVDVSGPGGLRRSYSIASDMRRADRIELQVRRVESGAMSDYWFDSARVDDLLRFRGPLGTFFLREVNGLDVTFLATGTGYAPIQSMLCQLAARPPDERPASVRLLWGGRLPQDLYADPLRNVDLAMSFTPVLSRATEEWTGARGHVQDVFLATAPRLERTSVYACGSDAMIRSARAALLAAGLPTNRFHSDAFVSSS
ncbi:MAG TPA: FAD-binding oxidoreductase [Burkholderiaceae bacterium]|nr:FAD-binding oxidoreductase [Burkholderiaceae bacterium]